MGIGIGVFVWPVITTSLIGAYGWRGALIVVAALHLHGVPCCAMLAPPPVVPAVPTVSAVKLKSSVLTYFENLLFLLKEKAVLQFLVGVLVTDMGHHAAFIFTVARAEELGLDRQGAAFILSILGAVSACARPIVGWLGDRRFVRRVVFHGMMCAFAGVTSCLSFFFPTFAGLLTTAIAFAIFSGNMFETCYKFRNIVQIQHICRIHNLSMNLSQLRT